MNSYTGTHVEVNDDLTNWSVAIAPTNNCGAFQATTRVTALDLPTEDAVELQWDRKNWEYVVKYRNMYVATVQAITQDLWLVYDVASPRSKGTFHSLADAVNHVQQFREDFYGIVLSS